MEKQRILVAVKTYPTLSKKYGETVCTAGVRPDGTWVRMYPVPFRRLDEEQQYSKFDWLECQLQRNKSDFRPETYRPLDQRELVRVGHMDTSDAWRERRALVLGKARVYESLDELIAGAKSNETSLAVFKPTRILDFIWEEESRDWDPDKLRQIREASNQFSLFDDNTWRETFKVIPKLPYSFSYKFEDAEGKPSTLQVLDWEAGQLYWNCLRGAEFNEATALAKVKLKYWDEFTKKDLHFFLGTTQEWHFRSPNPFTIIGVFPVPHQKQLPLF